MIIPIHELGPDYLYMRVFPKPTKEEDQYKPQFLVVGWKDAYLYITGWARPILSVAFRYRLQPGSGQITLKRLDTNQITHSYNYTDSTILNAQGGTWEVSHITNLIPNTWYEVNVPEGFFTLYDRYDVLQGINENTSWRFKTAPSAEILAYEMDSYPYTDDQGSVTGPLQNKQINNTTKRRINRTSNVLFLLGRRLLDFNMTTGTAPGQVGIQSPNPTAKLELYKKINDELIETIDLSKSFAVDRVGVRYTRYNDSLIAFSFTERFEPDTEYYLKAYGLVFDRLFQIPGSDITNPTILTFKTDGVKIVFASHDPEVERGFFNIGFDRPVEAGNGVLRIIDETAGRIINELRPNDYSAVFYDQTQTNGMSYSLVKDDWMLK